MLSSKFKDFALLMHSAAEKGVLLLFFAAAAFAIANTALANHYHHFLEMMLGFKVANLSVVMSVHHFINEFCMALFFLLVGIEIKREVLNGHLATTKQRILPLTAAFFGVITPAIIYYCLNMHSSINIRGWAIPTATDIAFALGMLALLGKGLPPSLRIFLTALAIIDDLIAVLIIAFFYSNNLNYDYLPCLMVALFALSYLNIISLRYSTVYLFFGLWLWYCLFKMGISPTVAGVMLAMFLPLQDASSNGQAAIDILEKRLAPWVLFLILPLFAFANCGISLGGLDMQTALFSSITLGTILGLFLGKQFGIFIPIYIMVKLRLASLPAGSNFIQFYAVSILCGIGFTMSLFIGIMAFGHSGEAYLVQMKLGVIIGSVLSLLYGAFIIKLIQNKVI